MRRSKLSRVRLALTIVLLLLAAYSQYEETHAAGHRPAAVITAATTH